MPTDSTADSADNGAARYDDSQLEEEVEKGLALLFAQDREDCSLDELFDVMLRADTHGRTHGREAGEAVERVLETMQTANKVVHRNGRIQLI